MTKMANYFKYKVEAYREVEKLTYLKVTDYYTDSLAEARKMSRNWQSMGFTTKIHRINEYDGFVMRELKTM